MFDLTDIGKITTDIDTIIAQKAVISKAVSTLKLFIEVKEAETVREVMTDSSLWLDGKRPSMDYIKNGVLPTGKNGELVEHRASLAEKESELESLKDLLRYKFMLIDIWRTQQANERVVL